MPLRALRPLITIALAGLVVAGVGASALVELRTIEDLRSRFNADRGNTRLVLLVSPT